jgi:hypothetical protein
MSGDCNDLIPIIDAMEYSQNMREQVIARLIAWHGLDHEHAGMERTSVQAFGETHLSRTGSFELLL